MNKITEIIPDDIPEWARLAIDEGRFFKAACERVAKTQKLRPMSEAPRDEEILAYQIDGKNLHQVKWQDHKNRWGMRWNNEYSQHDLCYLGWIPIPTVIK